MFQQSNKLSIYKCTGKGYERGWFTNFKGRYRIYKGGRNTKKSYVIIGLEVLMKIFSSPLRNVLIIRNTLSSHRYSTFSTLQMLINTPDPDNPEITFSPYFKISVNDMTITYKPTGQLILFKGLDDPQKIQGIRVPHGFLTDVYVEEAYELKNYDVWRKVDGSIRGKLPEGLFHQITFCFNAWNKKHWIYDKFFKGRFEDDFEYLLMNDYQDWCDPNLVLDYGIGLYLHTSTYKINEFRDKEIYDVAMEELREVALEIYKVEALGMWGNSSSTTYVYFNDNLIFNHNELMKIQYSQFLIGIDIGMGGEGITKYNTKDKPNRYRSAMTMSLTALSYDYSTVVCIDEFFYSNENQQRPKDAVQVAEDMINQIIMWCNRYKLHPTLMKGTICCYVDSADPGGFRTLLDAKANELHLTNIKFLPSTKNSIQTRVDFENLLMAFGEFKVCNTCKNLIREIKNARACEDGFPREDDDDHIINAMEYSIIPILPKIKRWNLFKPH